MQEEKNGRRKRLLTLLVTLAINIIIVAVIAVLEFGDDVKNAERVALSQLSLWFIAAGVLLFGVAVLTDYLKYSRMIELSEGRRLPDIALRCGILGKYYDNITPFGAGGQPFQILFLKKRGLSTGAASAIPIAAFLSQQIAFVIVAIVVFLANRDVIADAPVVRVSAYFGLVMYMILPVFILLFAVFPKPFEKLMVFLTHLLGKLRLFKDPEAAKKKVYDTLDEYVGSIRTIIKDPKTVVELMLYSVIYQLVIMSIPFCMLRGFGGESSWWTAFSLTVYIYAAITIIPTPGNSGAAEGSFYAVFSSLEGGFLFWAMILWRVLVYYSWLVLGVIIVATNTGSKNEIKK
ncbi:MAG: flippase-like domain-containing protein [Oscillospiraceae bacterium]|nr:flippase-like domain-containing protein [Oscillospiraceae bacterium]